MKKPLLCALSALAVAVTTAFASPQAGSSCLACHQERLKSFVVSSSPIHATLQEPGRAVVVVDYAYDLAPVPQSAGVNQKNHAAIDVGKATSFATEVVGESDGVIIRFAIALPEEIATPPKEVRGAFAIANDIGADKTDHHALLREEVKIRFAG